MQRSAKRTKTKYLKSPPVDELDTQSGRATLQTVEGANVTTLKLLPTKRAHHGAAMTVTIEAPPSSCSTRRSATRTRREKFSMETSQCASNQERSAALIFTNYLWRDYKSFMFHS